MDWEERSGTRDEGSLRRVEVGAGIGETRNERRGVGVGLVEGLRWFGSGETREVGVVLLLLLLRLSGREQMRRESSSSFVLR